MKGGEIITMNITFQTADLKSPSILTAMTDVSRKEPRNTFGVIDPLTKLKYEDVLKNHLQVRRITFNDWFIYKTITESEYRKRPFKLLLNHKTARKLVQELELEVIISFQVRTNGCYAVTRIFDPTRKGILRNEAI